MSGFDLGAISTPQSVELALGIGALVGVRTEEVALSLCQGRRQTLGTQRVVVRERGCERRHRDAERRSRDDDAPPTVDRVLDGVTEVRRQDEAR